MLLPYKRGKKTRMNINKNRVCKNALRTINKNKSTSQIILPQTNEPIEIKLETRFLGMNNCLNK